MQLYDKSFLIWIRILIKKPKLSLITEALDKQLRIKISDKNCE